MCAPAVPVLAAVGAASAATSTGLAIAGARRQAKANRKAQMTQEMEQRKLLDEQQAEFKRRQAGPPAPAGFLAAAERSPWLSSMFLTGGQGAPMGLRLGRTQALGGG